MHLSIVVRTYIHNNIIYIHTRDPKQKWRALPASWSVIKKFIKNHCVFMKILQKSIENPNFHWLLLQGGPHLFLNPVSVKNPENPAEIHNPLAISSPPFTRFVASPESCLNLNWILNPKSRFKSLENLKSCTKF